MTLATLALQLGAMEPDGHGGTQAGVILWRVTVCAFKFGLRPISLEENHAILLIASVLGVN